MYSKKDALAIGELSAIVYAPWEIARKILLESGFDNFTVYDEQNIEAMLVTDAENVYGIFRGTNELSDWLTNLSFTKVDVPYGEVHGGFKDGLDLIFDNLVTNLLLPLSNGN